MTDGEMREAIWSAVYNDMHSEANEHLHIHGIHGG